MILGCAAVAAFVASYAMTAWLLAHLRARQILDHPNARSSHSIPTPRGGGLSMVAITTCGVVAFRIAGWISIQSAAALLVGGLSVAAVGLWDDLRSVPVAIRMAVHIGAAVLAVYLLGSVAALRIGGDVVMIGVAGPPLCVGAIVWALNLFNFMDGIDGIAASEAAFMSLGAAAISLSSGHAMPGQVAVELTLGAACLGFLRWNWPPAAIFMGDIGSSYLGFAIALLAVQASSVDPAYVYVWLILGGVFFVDATWTLVHRLMRGERVHEAHRSHAYQRLARRWNSHRKVTVGVIVINVGWLLPCAAVAERYPRLGLLVCAIALCPLMVCAALAGAGRPT